VSKRRRRTPGSRAGRGARPAAERLRRAALGVIGIVSGVALAWWVLEMPLLWLTGATAIQGVSLGPPVSAVRDLGVASIGLRSPPASSPRSDAISGSDTAPSTPSDTKPDTKPDARSSDTKSEARSETSAAVRARAPVTSRFVPPAPPARPQRQRRAPSTRVDPDSTEQPAVPPPRPRRGGRTRSGARSSTNAIAGLGALDRIGRRVGEGPERGFPGDPNAVQDVAARLRYKVREPRDGQRESRS